MTLGCQLRELKRGGGAEKPEISDFSQRKNNNYLYDDDNLIKIL